MKIENISQSFEVQGDPVQRISAESPVLASSWLKGGQNLTPMQRVGHFLILVSYLGAGLFCAYGAKLNFQEGTVFMALLFSFASLFFFFFSAKGLQNILRFKRRP
jgi:hypothetical protein